jgi:hypothetical protein
VETGGVQDLFGLGRFSWFEHVDLPIGDSDVCRADLRQADDVSAANEKVKRAH